MILVPVVDVDAFSVTDDDIFEVAQIHQIDEFDGVVVVHPAAALRLCRSFIIRVFENANRAPVGEKPEFKAKAFHLYDLS